MILDIIPLGIIPTGYRLNNRIINPTNYHSPDNIPIHVGRDLTFATTLYKYKCIEEIEGFLYERIIVTTDSLDLNTFLGTNATRIPIYPIAYKVNGRCKLVSHPINELLAGNGSSPAVTVAQYGIEKFQNEFPSKTDVVLQNAIATVQPELHPLAVQPTDETEILPILAELQTTFSRANVNKACRDCGVCSADYPAHNILYNSDCIGGLLIGTLLNEDCMPSPKETLFQLNCITNTIPYSDRLRPYIGYEYKNATFRLYQSMYPPMTFPDVTGSKLHLMHDDALVSLGAYLLNQQATDISLSMDMVYHQLHIHTWGTYIQGVTPISSVQKGQLYQLLVRCILDFGCSSGQIQHVHVIKNYNEMMYIRFEFLDGSVSEVYGLDIVASLFVNKGLIVVKDNLVTNYWDFWGASDNPSIAPQPYQLCTVDPGI